MEAAAPSNDPSLPASPGRMLPPSVPIAESPSSDKAEAMAIKEEETEVSILETLDRGYESDASAEQETDTQLELELEKERYPGASTWARDEERLFEILFQRAERPILPGHWDVDFRGIPMLDTVFGTKDHIRPIVYSRSGKDFPATTALLRLIDLTSSVRTTIQSGLRQKGPPLIKKSLDRYISWAAEDGNYSHLRFVPNMITAVLDATLEEHEITSLMEQRMRALATVQREFLRVDRDVNFWDAVNASYRHTNVSISDALVDKFLGIMNEDSKRRAEGQEEEVIYRRKPPVVYGLFILRSSAFLLTVDSAKGYDAYVSFHVDMHFMDRHQSVWNALTVAIAVCLARDQLVERMEDFDEWPVLQESDSD
ncbi:hypothetical protein QQS21_008030 [Conoideocrella luteorostrata]|uniref:Uncharacterized protein n=1 Tax=Conoideocrella luteorostrata TaxID=1105319 RepID=A0AAJ0FRJ3_9HYPO|nr:hypothetical protein QQS21_008030 [Conoideocrella luteorostrata]